jgi:predicted MFS family arabinose efflux permease
VTVKKRILPSSFYRLWIGEGLSTLGGAFGTLVNGWMLFRLTGSETAMGTLWLVYFLPSLLVQLLTGPYLDRWSRTQILALSHGIRGAVFLLPMVLWAMDLLNPWHLYVVSSVSGIVQAVYAPASLAAVPSLVPEDRIQEANARMDGTLRLFSMLGPIAGGWVVAKLGPVFTWTLVILAFFTGTLLLMKVKENQASPQAGEKASWVRQFREGFFLFHRQKILWWLALFLAVVQLGVGVLMVLGLPYVAEELNGSAAAYGWFTAGFPLGYAIGSLLLSRRGNSRNLRRTMLGANLLGGLTFVGLSLAESIGMAVTIEVFAGICAPFFHVHATTLFQRLVPREHLAQVFSFRLLIIRCTMPLGNFLGGVLGELWGTRTIFWMVGLLIAFVSLAGMLLPYFRFLTVRVEDRDISSKRTHAG